MPDIPGKASCCSSQHPRRPFIVGTCETPVGAVPMIATQRTLRDRSDTVRFRMGFGRMEARIAPGLYAAGTPNDSAPVFVTANYKSSFDALRHELPGIDAWILVLETHGINVWCAAGKGTFSTEELVRRIREVQLSRVVSHRTVILPQLGAPGVAAHRVRELSGFRAVYGPIRARDLRAYLEAGHRATAAMRRVSFTIIERIVLVPVELRFAIKGALPLLAGVGSIAFLMQGRNAWKTVPWLFAALSGAFLVGSAIVPALLPYLPSRSFAIKGAIAGTGLAIAVSALHPAGWASVAGNLLLLPAIAAFCALNFTGSTTFTSQSGVNREIRLYARPIGIAALAGLVCTIIGLMIHHA